MQIIIPMSGVGARFRQAGYKMPKPLIEVDGLPIIAHVIHMFPGESKFIFICNEDHLATPSYKMEETIKKYCPEANIISIPAHKLGPVYAVLQATEKIENDKPVIVNYCDFTCDWDYRHFKQWIDCVQPDGCVPAYKGFHPHCLGSTHYAYIKEEDLWLRDIQEKQPYTDSPMDEFASSGTYYFKSGELMKTYFYQTIDQGLIVKGEYYASMVYKTMAAAGLKVAVYKLNHFMQWGTPEDLEEYQAWSQLFYALCQSNGQPNQSLHSGLLLMPMVGLGSRFQKEGYQKSKALISVSGSPMFEQALKTMPVMQSCFVLRSSSHDFEEQQACVMKNHTDAILVATDKLTDGQATSCFLAVDHIKDGAPLLITACDHGLLYNMNAYNALLGRSDVDVIVWVARGYANARRYPDMYGWVDSDEAGVIRCVSVKKSIGKEGISPIVTGTFTFKNGLDFKNSAELMFKNNKRVNGEFYVDTCINSAIQLGLRCVIFEVDSYLCWGTPNDLRTFEYWQGCFDQWKYHSYELAKDWMVDIDAVEQLRKHYIMSRSPFPAGCV